MNNTKKKLQSSMTAVAKTPAGGLNTAGIGMANPGKALNTAGISMANPGKGLNTAGIGMANPGKGLNTAGIGMANPGKGLNTAGIGMANPGKGLDTGGLNAAARPTLPANNGRVNPSRITQSYYTQPSTADNYDQNKPVYSQSDQLTAAGQAVANAEANKPGAYQSTYNDRIQGMIDDIMNQKPFQYDPNADPLYQQYAQQYQRNGELAMRDAMAQTAALTGGYGNTYAQLAGQQGYQRYMEDMNAMLPQLQQAAYQMYQDEGNRLRTNLGMLQSADQVDYGRYRDTVGDWQDELGYLYGKYNDMSQEEYNRYLNDRQSWENDRAYWYQSAQDQLDRDWLREQFEYQKQQDALAQQQSSGRKPSAPSAQKKLGLPPTTLAPVGTTKGPATGSDAYVGSDARKRHTSPVNQNSPLRYLYDR